MKKIFCIIGRSASGKSSITKAVAERLNLKVLKSYTTRPLRPGEDEVTSDHFFTVEEVMKMMWNDIVAYTEINGNKYFTTKQALMNSDLYVIDPEGFYFLQNKIEQLKLKIILVPIYIKVPFQEAKRRAKSRGDDMEKWEERYHSEDEQFKEYEEELKEYNNTYIVYNINFDCAVDEIVNFVISEKKLWKQFIDTCKYWMNN